MPTITEDQIVQIEIKIDEEKCVGCGTCISVCPVNLLELKVVGKEKKLCAGSKLLPEVPYVRISLRL